MPANGRRVPSVANVTDGWAAGYDVCVWHVAEGCTAQSQSWWGAVADLSLNPADALTPGYFIQNGETLGVSCLTSASTSAQGSYQNLLCSDGQLEPLVLACTGP